MQDKKQQLIHHISRLEGQLAAVKNELRDRDPDCEKAARTLKAASRSFSSLRMAFVICFLEAKFITKKQPTDETYRALLQVINS